MERKLSGIFFVFVLLFSCQDKKEQSRVSEKFDEEYKQLKVVHAEMEKKYNELSAEQDTLVDRLRKVRGNFSGEVEMFSQSYSDFLEKLSTNITKHNEILGSIARLEDELLNGEISTEEAMEERKDLKNAEKKVVKAYRQRLLQRLELIAEFEKLQTVEKKKN